MEVVTQLHLPKALPLDSENIKAVVRGLFFVPRRAVEARFLFFRYFPRVAQNGEFWPFNFVPRFAVLSFYGAGGAGHDDE